MHTTPVTFYSEGQRIDALWRTPDGATGPFRAIVQGPGWLGLKDSKLYVRYHEALTAAGFGVLIFDYRGFGDSEGDRGFLSPAWQLQDLINAVTYLTTRADVLADAIAYARVMMLTMPLLLVFVLSTQLLRGVSDTMTPLYALLISTGVGLVLTPSLIRGWAGLPQLGIVSAAVAGFCSYVVALVFLVWNLRQRKHPLAPDLELLRSLRLDPRVLRAVLRIGVPTGVQMVTISMAELAILGLVNGFGSDAVAAYGAVNQVVNYVQFPALSIAIAASILGAQSIGAGKLERLGLVSRDGDLYSAAAPDEALARLDAAWDALFSFSARR